ncbi:hypothetical protein BHE86_12220 [Shigella sp. FC1655]|nr:hypothetical protein BHE86_12220 [Shigella sp. FC1655]
MTSIILKKNFDSALNNQINLFGTNNRHFLAKKVSNIKNAIDRLSSFFPAKTQNIKKEAYISLFFRFTLYLIYRSK